MQIGWVGFCGWESMVVGGWGEKVGGPPGKGPCPPAWLAISI